MNVSLDGEAHVGNGLATGIDVLGLDGGGAGAAVLAEAGLVPEPADADAGGEGGGEVGRVADVVLLAAILELDALPFIDDAGNDGQDDLIAGELDGIYVRFVQYLIIQKFISIEEVPLITIYNISVIIFVFESLFTQIVIYHDSHSIF